MSSMLELEYLFPHAGDDSRRCERMLARPNSFEDVCDVLNGPESRGVLSIVKAQNCVREYLRKMCKLKRLGLGALMDPPQLGRFYIRQICREWECCADLLNAVVVSELWPPYLSEDDEYDKGVCMNIDAQTGNAGVRGAVYAIDIGLYARTVVPSFAMDIALSVRNAVDFVTIVDCKADRLDLGGRNHSDNQECMLMGVLSHPDHFRKYNQARLIPLATWPMQEYE
jgi:hypothetical protein